MSPSLRLALLLCVVVPLSFIPLGLDVWAAYSFVRQARAEHRPSVPGTITESTVVTSRGNKGATSTRLQVRYTYTVEGRTYEGTRLRYILSNGYWATVQDLARRFPQDSQARVFYRPEAPADALLQPGLRGSDFLALMVLGVLHLLVAALGMLVMGKPAREVPSVGRDGRTHVTLIAIPPVVVGLLALGIGLMAGHIAWTVGAEPSVAEALLLWLAVFALGGVATLAQRYWLSRGGRDLILDERTRTLSLPALLERAQRLDVPWSQVVAVHVEARGIGGGKRLHGLVLELRVPPGLSRREVVCEWVSADRAHTLAHWLRSRLNLPEHPQETRTAAIA